MNPRTNEYVTLVSNEMRQYTLNPQDYIVIDTLENPVEGNNICSDGGALMIYVTIDKQGSYTGAQISSGENVQVRCYTSSSSSAGAQTCTVYYIP